MEVTRVLSLKRPMFCCSTNGGRAFFQKEIANFDVVSAKNHASIRERYTRPRRV